MRPVLLDLDGFGSFRAPCTVDFRDADWFALVGPTGAGKSTVVDAIVFALYGSVPRWEDRRAVGWALAPTASRGVVSLTFDVGTARYVVARELRRSAAGKVTVKSARLERDATVLAADGEVTGAVEKLLGLTYDHFVRCVILPQGDFARFLHSTAKERQDTLVDLLGIRVYREVASRARVEEAAQRQRAGFAAQRLEAYADATAEAAAAAAARIEAVATAGAELARRVPELVRAGAAVAAAAAGVRRLTGEQELLAALRVPAGLDRLVAGRRAAAAGLAEADAELAVAEKADTAVREALAAAPARAPLERARDAFAELGRLAAGLPGLQAEQEALEARLGEVEAAGRAARAEVGAARAEVGAARAARDEAQRADLAAAVRAHLVVGEPCPVCAQQVAALPGEPDAPAAEPEGVLPGLDLPAGRGRAATGSARRHGVPAPGRALAAANERVAAADERVAAADAAVERLQRDWQAAHRDAERAAGRLRAGTERMTELRRAVDGGPDAAGVAAALAELDGLDAAVRAADGSLRAARRARDAAARADQAAQARLADARTELDRARDPLVPLGAPAPGRVDL